MTSYTPRFPRCHPNSWKFVPFSHRQGNCSPFLSLVSNAILYWNTAKIGETVERLRAEGESIDDEELSHVSLLPFRHVMPNGTYFIEDQIKAISVRKPTLLEQSPESRP